MVWGAGVRGDHLHLCAGGHVHHDRVLDVLVPERCRSTHLLLATAVVCKPAASGICQCLLCHWGTVKFSTECHDSFLLFICDWPSVQGMP